jgi:hypothetical protein
MRDARAVRRVERARDFRGRAQQLGQRQRSALEPPLQRLSLDVFHHEIVAAVLAADVVDRADMRVVEGGNRARFTLEPQAVLGIVAVWTDRQLQGNRAAKARVASAIHLAHAAGARQAVNLVRTEPRALCERHGCGMAVSLSAGL